ncbi:MAG: hypothetical protein HDS81_00570 [Bacteroidales bacterium]|nr:hypothetical protein [Bacteroidales bacterium]
MSKKTYGTPRLVDWVAQIKAGSASVRVHFSGGALTSYGITPAEYTTSNPFIQKVIEQSSYFKEGRITLMRESNVPESNGGIKVSGRKPKERATNPVSADTKQVAATAQNATVNNTSTDVKPDETADFTKVAISCLQDAHAYLQENYGISSYKVRSYEAAQKAAAEHGVQFTGGKFDTLNSCDSSATEGENNADEVAYEAHD